jgi:hypothetical protein
MRIEKVDSIERLDILKHQYMEQTTAPLDGMWMSFVSMATHFGFFEDEKLVGFFCTNDDGYLLQFHVIPERQDDASLFFASVITRNDSSIHKINGAFVSTAEPQFLSLCLDSFPGFHVHALMYQHSKGDGQAIPQDDQIPMRELAIEELAEAVEFANRAVGAPEEWLTGYYSNLIDRREANGCWENGSLVAIGECRGFDEYQTAYADLGVIVGTNNRGKGLATRVLKHLVILAERKGLKAICSTETGNIGAQTAIGRAGFFAGNRIVQFDV